MFLLTLFYNAFSLLYPYFKLFDGDHPRKWSRTFARMVVYICAYGRQQTNIIAVQRVPPIFNKSGITLHVPRGSEELYRKADHWNVAEVVGDL